MADHETNGLHTVHIEDIPSTSTGPICHIDVEESADESIVVPESVSEVEVEAEPGTSDEDMKPPLLLAEEPTISDDAGTSPPIENTENPENTILISSDDLAEAGLDMDSLNNLTSDQLVMLMEIAERRVQREMEGAQRSDSVDSQQPMEEVPDENYVDESVAVSNEALTMVITDDGSLKLTDACNQVFFFSAQQLGSMNIDVNNLTDESIQQIVHCAMPDIQVGKPPTQPQGEEEHPVIYDHDVNSGSTAKPGMMRASQLIGEQIEIRRNGKAMPATIRYVRNGGAFKVQFEDGHFEWVTEDQIVIRPPRMLTDHEGYHNGSSATVPRVVHASSLASLKRAAATVGCRETKRPNLEPNFCCPICDNKVYQKEPAYIVIRIPACDSCTREKIIVLDDEIARDADDHHRAVM